MILLVKDLHNLEQIVVMKIRCNNLGENVAFKAAVKEGGLALPFEFMAC